ncbi:kinase-like domain-containing protein [Xylogone sp. PMI_703]|nr:kinase-like domain-containing protein [Xylogone sp. PMI_703]
MKQPQRVGSDNPSFPTESDEVTETSELKPLFSWKAELSETELSWPKPRGYLDVHSPSSVGSGSSVVNDGGNAKYLVENETSSHQISNKDSRDVELDHIGAGVGNTIYHTELNEIDFRLDNTLPRDEVRREDSGYQLKENLGQSIRASLISVSRAGEKNKFLPNDALARIITRQRVRHELSSHKVATSKELDTLTDQVWEITTTTASLGKQTTRRKIFAILGLMDKVEDIIHFVEAGLYDNDLPFKLQGDSCPQLRLSGKGRDDDTGHILLFDKWRPHEIESFNTYQWQLIAPYFRLVTGMEPKVLHYNLQNEIILPFIVDLEQAGRAEGHNVGGFADVWRVQIHPAHHNYCKDNADSSENPSYAVKRLRLSDQKAFDEEVSSLKRFSKRDHLHLIKLLATYKWRGQFYLLFPWADGNLLNFWQRFPNQSCPERDYKFTLWFSEQCLGIVQGLKMIHKTDVPSQLTDAPTGTPKHQIHGRHGDLKPENILWFKSYEDGENDWCGVLKISDFGLTRFHRTQSMSRVESIAVSPTYRAPEYDIASKVSQSYDIWTLGCVLLEFVTWYLLGWEEVDKFSKARTSEDSQAIADSTHIPEDTFFNFVEIKTPDGEKQLGARAKQAVQDVSISSLNYGLYYFAMLDTDLPNLQEFHDLFKHQNCSDYILDLLMFIKERLLRIDPNKRAKCEETVERFQKLNNECKKDRDYCMKRIKKSPVRTGTALSELAAAALNLSEKQSDRIRRDSMLKHEGPLEGDSPSNELTGDQSLASDLDNRPPADRSTLGTFQVGQKGKMLERKDKVKLPPISVPHEDDTQSTLSGRKRYGTQDGSPLSPRRVRFEEREQQSQEAPVNSAHPPKSILVPEQPDSAAPSFSSSTEDAQKVNTPGGNDSIPNPLLHSSKPADILEADSKSQEENSPTIEQPDAPVIPQRNKPLAKVTGAFKRFFHGLCCVASGD